MFLTITLEFCSDVFDIVTAWAITRRLISYCAYLPSFHPGLARLWFRRHGELVDLLLAEGESLDEHQPGPGQPFGTDIFRRVHEARRGIPSNSGLQAVRWVFGVNQPSLRCSGGRATRRRSRR